MSRSIVLTVLIIVGASFLTATVKTEEWYDSFYTNENLLPEEVYAILKSYESDPEASKYMETWSCVVPRICLREPYTKDYDGKIGGGKNPSAALTRYIEYCEERRKETCEEVAIEVEKRLFDDIGYWYGAQIGLSILAKTGDERAEKILGMLDPNRKCAMLDELRDLASFPLREAKESVIVAEFQRATFEEFKTNCEEYERALEKFREGLYKLEKKEAITPEDLKNLDNLQQKVYTSGFKYVDPKDVDGPLREAKINPDLKKVYRSMFNRSGDLQLICERLYFHIGDSRNRLENAMHIESLREIPRRFDIEANELEWIRKFFLCMPLIEFRKWGIK